MPGPGPPAWPLLGMEGPRGGSLPLPLRCAPLCCGALGLPCCIIASRLLVSISEPAQVTTVKALYCCSC